MPKRTAPIWVPYPVAAASILAASVTGPSHGTGPRRQRSLRHLFCRRRVYGLVRRIRPGGVSRLLSYADRERLFHHRARAFAFDVATFAYLFVCLVIALFSEAMRRALRRAEASAERVISIVESINDGFVAVDGDWPCTYMNRAAEEYMARHRQRGVGLGPRRAVSAVDGRRRRGQAPQAAREAVTVEFESYYEPWERWFEIKASPAEAGGLAIHFRDITEREAGRAGAGRKRRAPAAGAARRQGRPLGPRPGDRPAHLVRRSTMRSTASIAASRRRSSNSSARFIPTIAQAVDKAIDEAIDAGQAARHSNIASFIRTGRVRWIAVRGRTTTDNTGRAVAHLGHFARHHRTQRSATRICGSFPRPETCFRRWSTSRARCRRSRGWPCRFSPIGASSNIVGQFGETEHVAHAHRDRVEGAGAQATRRALLAGPAVRRCSRCASWKLARRNARATCRAEALDALAPDAEHRRLLATLAPISFIVVPLLVRERTIGSMTFVSSESGRHYAPADVEMATELAHRRGRGHRQRPAVPRAERSRSGRRTISWPCWPTSCAIRWRPFSMPTSC